MQPIKLSVRGFTSFKTDQELDFTALDSLFVITGPHGAGKSSILDAISFALFGKVPRDLAPKDLLSQGRDRLTVQFEFACGQERYKVTRDYDFKTKSGKTFVALEILEKPEKWRSLGIDTVKGITQKISELLGIDAETFFKIVLLPQGEFAEFLQGTPSNRKAILEKLFPEFGIFKRMAELAAQQTSNLTGQRAWVASQLDRLQAPTEAEMAELIAERERAQTELTTAETERDRLAAELKTAKDLAEKVTELARQEMALAQLRDREPEIQQQRATLAAARQAASLEASWQQYDSARNLVAATTARLEEATRAWEAARQSLVCEQAKMEALQRQEAILVAREVALAAAAEPAQACDRTAREWQQAQTEWQERQTALETARTQHDRALAAVENLAAQQATARAEMERYAPGGDRLTTLQAVVQHLLPQWEALQTDLVAWGAESNRIRASLETCDRAWEKAQQELANAQEAHKNASAEVEAARNHEAASLLRANLHKGDACPVCNGTFKGHKHEQLSLTDALLSDADLSALITRQHECSDRLETDRAQANRAEIALTQARERHHQTEANGDRLQVQIADLDGKISAQLDATTWDAVAIAAECQQLQAQDAAYQSANEAYAAAEKAWQEARTQWQLLQQQLSATTREVDRAGALLEAKTTARDRAAAELAEALSELQKELGDLPYARLQAAISTARQDFDRQLQTARTTYDRERDAQVRAETAAAAAKTAREEAETSLAAQGQTWATALAQFSWDEAKFLSARQPYDRCQELEKILETHDRQRLELDRRVADLRSEIGDRALDPAATAAQTARWETSQTTCMTLARHCQELALKIETGQRDRAQATELTTQKQDLDRQLDIAETLKKELGGRNFQRYLQDALQGDLLASASQKLEQLSDRYSLTTDGSGNYLVEDRWNGGERRKVSSLSGGETFMASLAMALALGDLLAQGNQIGSLFLDEGFGSLDSEAIETAISTLENLRRDDRIVGIITHVKAVADRIPSQIQIVKSEQGSTAILA